MITLTFNDWDALSQAVGRLTGAAFWFVLVCWFAKLTADEGAHRLKDFLRRRWPTHYDFDRTDDLLDRLEDIAEAIKEKS